MSKYYKADDVINAIENKIVEYIPTLYGRYELRMAIENLPSIDIVRCKECRRKDNCEKIVVYEHFCGDIYDAEKIHFCEHGERKDNE